MDEELERAARRITAAQDREAEATLAQVLLPRVRAFCIRYLRARDTAEDVAHDAMLIVLASLRAGRVQDLTRVAAFSLATCRTLIFDRARTARRREELLDKSALPVSVDPPDDGPLDRERLARCLAKLEPRERHVIKFTFWEDRTAQEIAEKLDLKAGHVRVIRHRAIERLSECVSGRRASR